jgi:tetratricopeptide (TPR) repeat protein
VAPGWTLKISAQQQALFVSGNCKMSLKSIFAFLISFFLLVSCRQTTEQLLNKGYNLSKEKKYDEAIKVYTEVIKRNRKLQLAYYNRGLAYNATKQYNKALADFNEVMSLQTSGGYIVTFNKDMPYASDEVRAQVPYQDALYQRAQVKYYMDSLRSSFRDFQALIENNYEEKSNCLLWQGTIYLRNKKSDRACDYFNQAKQIAVSDDDKKQADEMISTYCSQTNNYH